MTTKMDGNGMLLLAALAAGVRAGRGRLRKRTWT